MTDEAKGETPETDAAEYDTSDRIHQDPNVVVDADFSRTLAAEREGLRLKVSSLSLEAYTWSKALEQVIAERDALRSQLAAYIAKRREP